MGVNWPGEPVSWNPVVGCGGDGLPCIERCWAKAVAGRGLTEAHRKVAKWDGTVALSGGAMFLKNKPTLYAVCLMGDLFHKNVPYDWQQLVANVMLESKQHTFLILTKRPENADRLARQFGWARADNIWLGTSVANQDEAEARIPALLRVPAKHHWLSYEPAVGPLLLTERLIVGLGAVIAGCESGRGRRPCPDQWLDSVASQCRAAGVPCFVKQRDGGNAVVAQPMPAAWPWVK